ncbi:unnamed protein product, partial [Polarella glacialis]
AGACPEGQIACWMTCMSTEGLESCSGGAWRPTGLGDTAKFSSLSVQCREPNNGKIYPSQTGSMCPTCRPTCTVTGADSPAPGHVPDHYQGSSFCNSDGATTMYMEGFRWTVDSPDQLCLTFLWPGLQLNAAWKLMLACLATVFMSSLVELVGVLRRALPQSRQKDFGLACHAAGLALAYIAMLCVMTYSYELFFSVLLGLLLGHVMSARVARRIVGRGGLAGAGSSGGTPCCNLAAGHEASQTLLGLVETSPKLQ